MGNFFSPEGAFYRYGSLVADIMMLSIIYLFVCLPIITIGPATTAVYYVMTKKISERDGYMFKDFFKSFKENFIQSLLSWLILVVLIAVFGFSALTTYLNGFMPIFLPVQGFLLLESFMVYIFIFPVISRFDLSFKEAFKTAFFMANKHIPSSFLCILLVFVFLILVYSTRGLFLFIGNAAYAYCASFIFVKLFKKYRPELDA